MTKYQKKQVLIEAIQWNGTNHEEVLDFMVRVDKKECHSIVDSAFFGIDLVDGECKFGNVIIKKSGRDMEIGISDYLVYGADGEFHCQKSETFNERYESVGDNQC